MNRGLTWALTGPSGSGKGEYFKSAMCSESTTKAKENGISNFLGDSIYRKACVWLVFTWGLQTVISLLSA